MRKLFWLGLCPCAMVRKEQHNNRHTEVSSNLVRLTLETLWLFNNYLLQTEHLFLTEFLSYVVSALHPPHFLLGLLAPSFFLGSCKGSHFTTNLLPRWLEDDVCLTIWEGMLIHWENMMIVWVDITVISTIATTPEWYLSLGMDVEVS